MASFQDLWAGLEQAGGASPYLLIDCAGLEGGAAALPRDACAEIECLFTGDLAVELADVAPWLGRLRSYGHESASAAEDLLKRQAGMLVVLAVAEGAPLSFAQLHRHFRKFNVVYDPDGKPLFFRYYDPRVIVDVLKVLEPAQLDAFFGPVDSLVLLDAAQAPVRCFRQGGKLAVQG